MRLITLLSLLLAFTSAVAHAQPTVTPNAPVKNFRLPVLDKDGNRTSLLRGVEARYIDANRIDLFDMQYNTFDPKALTQVEGTLLAPTATVVMQDKKVTVMGKERVRLIWDAVDATGEDWTYEHEPSKRIQIHKNVRVVFRVELKNLIK